MKSNENQPTAGPLRNADKLFPPPLPREGGRSTKLAEQFAVVGLGGSAGSLLAFEQFFRAMPADCGMGFVVVWKVA